MKTRKYQVTGLTCGGCVNRVKSTLARFAETVDVTLDPPAAVLINAKADINTLNQLLKEIGNYQLLAIETPAQGEAEEPKNWLATYKPLLFVIAYIVVVTLAIEVNHGAFVLSRWMPNFMAGFFIVFSFFKMLDLKGFANSYATYDLLAKKHHAYGMIYPFIELGLGLSYLLKWQPQTTNWITLIVMSFSTIGVLRAVMNRQKIKCACLGTGFNLPMSTVTIIEDVSMVAMAAWMLI